MNKRIKGMTIALVVLILILFFYFIYNISGRNDKVDNLTQLIESTISFEIENYDQETKDSIKKELKEILESSLNDDKIIKANVILANIYMEEKNNEEAEKCLNKAVKYISNYNDTKVKGLIYFTYSRLYLFNNEYKKSEVMFEKMKEIYKDKEDELIIAFSANIAIDLLEEPNGKNKAIKVYEEALDIAKRINYNEIENLYFRIGVVYWYADMYIESMEAKLEAINIAESKGLTTLVAKIYIDIGVDYLYQEEYAEAISYLSKGLSYINVTNDEEARNENYALINLCEAYTRMGSFEEAKKYFNILENSINNREESANKEDYLTFMYLDRADLESEMGNPKKALELLDLANSRYESRLQFTFLDFDVELAEEYGDAYYKLGDYEKSLEYHKQLEKLVKEREITYLEENTYIKIHDAYKAIGNDLEALKYLGKSYNIMKENSSKKNIQYAQYLINKFESDKNEEEIYELNKFKHNVSIVILALTLILTVILVCTYAIYKKNIEINRLNKLFKELSVTDFITKIQNRRFLDAYLEENWSIYKARNMMISFMMIDVDYFKKYNDNYGHQKGDEALINVAEAIKKSSRNSDIIARYGGEEFILILLDTDKNVSINIANRIMANLHDLNIEHEYSEVSDRLTTSIGICTGKIVENEEYPDYIKIADEALYMSKDNGRNRYTILEK